MDTVDGDMLLCAATVQTPPDLTRDESTGFEPEPPVFDPGRESVDMNFHAQGWNSDDVRLFHECLFVLSYAIPYDIVDSRMAALTIYPHL